MQVEISRRGPIIIVREQRDYTLNGREHVFLDRCKRCGKLWRYTVGEMGADRVINDATDNQARAVSLFKQYRDRGIGPCCMKPDHRLFIAKHARFVMYERLD